MKNLIVNYTRCRRVLFNLYIHFILFIITFLLLIRDYLHRLFNGGDGEYYMRAIHLNFEAGFNSFFSMPINPYQEMGGIVDPLNTIVIPAFLAFIAIDDPMIRAIVTYLVFGIQLFAAIYLLAHVYRLTRSERIIATWIGTLIAMPITPASTSLGIYGIPHLQALFICSLALAAFVQTGRNLKPLHNWARIFVLVLLTVWALVSVPEYAAIGALSHGLMAVGALLGAGSATERRWKILAAVLVGLAFIIFGFHHYLLGLSSYTTRFFFDVAKPLNPALRIGAFAGRFVGILAVLSLLTACVLLASRRKRVRAVALSGLAPMVPLFLYSLFTVVFQKRINIDGYQIEFYLIPLYGLLVTIGLCRLLPQGAGTLLRRMAGNNAPFVPRQRILLRLVSYVCIAIFAVFTMRSPLASIFLRSPKPSWTVQESKIITYLQKQVSVTGTQPWRGSVVAFPEIDKSAPVQRHYKPAEDIAPRFKGNGHADYFLRYFKIPTLAAVNNYLTPQFSYFGDGLLRNNEYKNKHVAAYADRVRPRILRAMGVRYIINDKEITNPQGRLVISLPGDTPGPALLLYDFGAPNVGDYSPTDVRYAETAKQVIGMLDDDRFDFRKSVVLLNQETVGGPLVPIDTSQLSLAPGGFRLTAHSPGRSLLVLPLQYSACLTWNPNPGTRSSVQLVRANLVQTGLLFDGAIDGRLSYAFGPFHSTDCRFRDADTFRALTAHR